MTKKEIVKQISEEVDLTQLKTKQIVQKTFDAIVETLVTDKRIELRNFGVFEVKKRAARKARNPRTGDQVDVAEKYVVTFKPGKEMEERVRLLDEEEAARSLAGAASTARAESAAGRQGTSGTLPLGRPAGMGAPSSAVPPSSAPPQSAPPSSAPAEEARTNPSPGQQPGGHSSDSTPAPGGDQPATYGTFGQRPGE